MFDKESDIKVYVTENYSIFNFLESNRAVNQNQVKKIVKSIQAKGYYPVPILVDDKNNDEVPLIKLSFYVCTYPFDYLFQTMLEEAGIKIKSFKRLSDNES